MITGFHTITVDITLDSHVYVTGQPIMNPDGTMHKFTPGQPLPQQAGNYTSGPQQQQQQAIYQTPQEWSLHSQVKH